MRFPLDRNLLYDSSLGEELLLFERHNSQSREFIITFPFTGKTVRQLNNSPGQPHLPPYRAAERDTITGLWK